MRLDGLVYVNAVVDCADRECIGLNVSRRNDAREAAWAFEDALIRRFGALPRGNANVTLRTDNALVYASELYRDLAKSYGIHQDFILPHTPEQAGVTESLIGALKLECVWQHRFKTYEEAKSAINVSVQHYNESRPHSRRGYRLPV
ncbi:MAG: integrase core domain-containing protein [Candidatus Baltobacteraceae bacterium]